jgi:hypothetical protein
MRAPIDRAATFEEIEQFLNDNLVVRWKDELASLQDAGVVDPAEVRKAFPRSHEIKAFVDEYLEQKKVRTTA